MIYFVSEYCQPIRMAPVRSPRKGFRVDSPFSKEQSAFIIFEFGRLQSLKLVQREFRKKYFPQNPRQVPRLNAFLRLVDRFKKEAAVRPKVTHRSPQISDADVQRVKSFFQRNKKAHIRQAVQEMNLSFGTIWRILRKVLKWKAYRPHLVQVLSPANMESRVAACSFWLSFEEEWFERVLWSDEKWFVLQNSPNKQTNRFWAPLNPHDVIQCKKAHGKKAMCWVGIVDGRCLPVVWFEGSVDSKVYLEKVLQGAVWPSVKGVATRKQLWFQQDGASCHVTKECLDFIKSKFGDRVISRSTDHHWPPYSPDLSPLDFSLWGQALAHVVRCKPKTIDELKIIVNDFTVNLGEEKIRSMARHTRKRAELCCQVRGGHFEHLLQKK